MEKLRKIGTWSVRSLYTAGSLTTAARKLARYKLDSVGVQGVRWDKVGMSRAGDSIYFYRKGNKNCQLGAAFLHRRIVSAVRRVEFVSNSNSSVMSLV